MFQRESVGQVNFAATSFHWQQCPTRGFSSLSVQLNTLQARSVGVFPSFTPSVDAQLTIFAILERNPEPNDLFMTKSMMLVRTTVHSAPLSLAHPRRRREGGERSLLHQTSMLVHSLFVLSFVSIFAATHALPRKI
jgi:hypothetical protein